jgi:beta-glucanase (GH16 family)
MFLMLTLSILSLYSQDYCEGYGNSWRGKEKNFGNVPTYNIPITTGWVAFSPFTDEFNTFDNSKWTKINGSCHTMSTDSYFSNSTDNVYVSAGKLFLKAKLMPTPVWCEHWDTAKYYNYSSGYISSNNAIRYGYIEIKCKLPSNIALAPCFWMFGQTGQYVYPFTGYEYDEIDVFEPHMPESGNDLSKTVMQNFYHNLHDPLTTQSSLRQNIFFSNTFLNQDIIFAVEWLPEEIHFYVNGHLTKSVKFADDSSGSIDTDSDFTCTNFLDARGQKFQISLSVNNLISTYTDVSQGFEIDYVRSYKLAEGFNYEYWPSSFSMTDPNMFKVHKNIRLGGTGKTATIPQDENITIWATDGIILDKGFTVSGNTTFTARNIATTNLFIY